MTDRRKLYQEFQEAFPIGKLDEMNIDQYTNLEKNDSFCYWLEAKTSDLGSIWGGSSFKFGVYRYQKKPKNHDTRIVSDDKYAWYAKYKKNNAQDAFEIVRSAVKRIATYAYEQNFSAIESIKEVGDAYKWKIAFLYSNDKLIPIYKKEMLVDLATHFGMSDPDKANHSILQSFLIEQKGNKDVFDFYEELLAILDSMKRNPKYWIFSPGEDASKWSWCQSEGMMCLGWNEMGDLAQYKSRSEITKMLQKLYKKDTSFKNDSLALWEFVHEMKIGDIIYAKKGRSTIVGRGIVKDEYCYDESLDSYNNVRKVEWTDKGERVTGITTPLKTLTNITRKTDDIKEIERLFGNSEQVSAPSDSKNYWLLVASPKVWQFSNLGINKEVSYSLYNDIGNKRRIFQNLLGAKKGDLVIGYEANPVKQIVALAEVSKEADNKYIWFKKVELLLSPVSFSDFKELPELANMEFIKNSNGSFFKLTEDEYNTLIELIRDNNPQPKDVAYDPYTEDDFLKEVFMQPDEYRKLKTQLLNKKNIILQGAPGVGKTFSARRLAFSIMGKKDTSRMEVIQFHQNYSYEDLIMGYRPNDNGGFDLKSGVFYSFCKKAQAAPENEPYFFIIDEINRGNLSKAFGELFMLIEKDYRGQQHAIKLAYKDEMFFVPKNLHIIGMMNTADRSLAMIDYALRRRFSFFEMKPGFASDGFKSYLKSNNSKEFEDVIKGIIDLNKVIKDDESLGSGFCIGHSYFCTEDTVNKDWLKNVIEFDICPMLSEYWFDKTDKYGIESAKLHGILK